MPPSVRAVSSQRQVNDHVNHPHPAKAKEMTPKSQRHYEPASPASPITQATFTLPSLHTQPSHHRTISAKNGNKLALAANMNDSGKSSNSSSSYNSYSESPRPGSAVSKYSGISSMSSVSSVSGATVRSYGSIGATEGTRSAKGATPSRGKRRRSGVPGVDYDLTIFQAVQLNDLLDVANMIAENPDIVNSMDKSGSTPLHWACRKGHTDIALLLLVHGANLSLRNKSGRSPEDLAVEQRHEGLSRRLKRYKYSLTAQTRLAVRAFQSDSKFNKSPKLVRKSDKASSPTMCRKISQQAACGSGSNVRTSNIKKARGAPRCAGVDTYRTSKIHSTARSQYKYWKREEKEREERQARERAVWVVEHWYGLVRGSKHWLRKHPGSLPIVSVVGDPLTGKSALATAIADRFHMRVLRLDELVAEEAVAAYAGYNKIKSNASTWRLWRSNELITILAEGEVIPVDWIVDLFTEAIFRMKIEDASSGFVLDGFPFTLAQARLFGMRLACPQLTIRLKCKLADIMQRVRINDAVVARKKLQLVAKERVWQYYEKSSVYSIDCGVHSNCIDVYQAAFSSVESLKQQLQCGPVFVHPRVLKSMGTAHKVSCRRPRQLSSPEQKKTTNLKSSLQSVSSPPSKRRHRSRNIEAKDTAMNSKKLPKIINSTDGADIANTESLQKNPPIFRGLNKADAESVLYKLGGRTQFGRFLLRASKTSVRTVVISAISSSGNPCHHLLERRGFGFEFKLNEVPTGEYTIEGVVTLLRTQSYAGAPVLTVAVEKLPNPLL